MAKEHNFDCTWTWNNTAPSGTFLAVIPLTDSEHGLLPLQFWYDPGEDYSWTLQHQQHSTPVPEYLDPMSHNNLLNNYLETVKVALPDWLIDGLMEQGKRKSTRKIRKDTFTY